MISSLRVGLRQLGPTLRIKSVQTSSTAYLTISSRPFSDQSGKEDASSDHKQKAYWTAAKAAGAVVGLAGVSFSLREIHLQAKSAPDSSKKSDDKPCVPGERIEGLKEYTMDEVSEHDSVEKRVWVTYNNGVYDITEFIPLHPGADKLMMAAGGGMEPFWAMYAFHKTDKNVCRLLEEYRIGNLNTEDVQKQKETNKDGAGDPFANDPKRHRAIIVNNPKPFNGETPLSIITDSFLTPNELFYVRNHLPVPEIDPEEYELEVEGKGVKELKLTLEDLKKMPKHTIVAAIQCAGNRRAEMRSLKELKGLNWRGGAMGNAEWTGVKLRDVLLAAGYDDNDKSIQHVHFEGMDHDASMHPFAASIPIEKAADPRGDVLLAYEMNGETLPRDHGFPIRVVVPGCAGVRNVKWLGRITVSEAESDSHHQTHDYKGFNPSTDWDNVNWEKSQAIQDMPVTSSICFPAPGYAAKEKEELEVSGYAWSGGGRKIIRVDLTADGGKTWTSANSLVQDDAKHPRHWGWTLWKGKVQVPEGVKDTEIWSKAVDSSYNVQPESFLNIWNLRGCLSNAYCKIKINVGG